MGLEDRDWYREAYKEKEKKYGSDFSRSPGRTNKNVSFKTRKSSGIRTVIIYAAIIAAVIAIVFALKSQTVRDLLNNAAGSR